MIWINRSRRSSRIHNITTKKNQGIRNLHAYFKKTTAHQHFITIYVVITVFPLNLASSRYLLKVYNLHHNILSTLPFIPLMTKGMGIKLISNLLWCYAFRMLGHILKTCLSLRVAQRSVALVVTTFETFPFRGSMSHDDVIKWKHVPRNRPFVRGIHRSWWIPHTKASDAELWCFLWSASE